MEPTSDAELPKNRELHQSILSLKAFDAVGYRHFVHDQTGGDISKVASQAKQFCKSEAAVLIPLFIRDNSVHVLLTVRSHAVSQHKGEVCFPGGRRDAEDRSPSDTALRESYEEIGLPPSYVQVIARLVPVFSRHNFLVYPIIGYMRDRNFPLFVPSHNGEVSKTFSLPLERFLSARDHSSLVLPDNGLKKGTGVVSTVTDKSALSGKEQRIRNEETEGHFDYRLHFFKDVLSTNHDVMTFGLTATLCVMTAVAFYRRLPPFPVGGFLRMSSVDGYLSAQEKALQKSLEWRKMQDAVSANSKL